MQTEEGRIDQAGNTERLLAEIDILRERDRSRAAGDKLENASAEPGRVIVGVGRIQRLVLPGVSQPSGDRQLVGDLEHLLGIDGLPILDLMVLVDCPLPGLEAGGRNGTPRRGANIGTTLGAKLHEHAVIENLVREEGPDLPVESPGIAAILELFRELPELSVVAGRN